MHGSHFLNRNDVLLPNKAINAPEWNLVMCNSFGLLRIVGGVRRMIADFSLMLRLSCSAPHSHPAVIPTHDLELYLLAIISVIITNNSANIEHTNFKVCKYSIFFAIQTNIIC